MASLRPMYANWDLDFYENYLKTTLGALQKEWEAHDATIRQLIYAEDDEYKQTVDISVAMHSVNLYEKFPALLINTTFISVFSFLEDQMVQICEDLRKMQGHKLRYKDLSGQTFEQCKAYLTKICRVEVPTQMKEWSHILLFQQIRNVIIHRRGKMLENSGNPKERELHKFFADYPDLLDDESMIVLSKDSCLNAIGVIRAFINALYAAADNVAKPAQL